MTAFIVMLPEATRRLRSSIEQFEEYTRRASQLLSIITIALTVGLFAAPEQLGIWIAGPNWRDAKAVLLPTGLWVLGLAMSHGARVGLQVLEESRLVLRVAVAAGAIMFVAASVGSLADGASGAAWGFALASLAGQLVWTRAYKRSLGRREQHA
jgi:O-antigen/teichoic acid export membrane protein